MYIWQTTLFPFEEIIKFQQQTKLELILEQIDVSILANTLRKNRKSRGPKGYNPECLIYSLIAMQVEKINSIKDLVLKLKENPVLRYAVALRFFAMYHPNLPFVPSNIRLLWLFELPCPLESEFPNVLFSIRFPDLYSLGWTELIRVGFQFLMKKLNIFV